MSSKSSSIYDLLEAFSSNLEKQATEGIAAKTDAAGADKLTPASGGSQSADNTAEVKDQVPNSVDETSPDEENSTGGLKTPALSTGLKSDETGKGVPTPNSTLEDPGTSHPAKVGGEKYASARDLIDGMNSLLADFAVMAKRASDEEAVKAAKAPVAPKAAKGSATQLIQKAVATKAAAAKPVEPATVKSAAVDPNTVSVPREEYDTLVKAAAAFDELMGHLVGQRASEQLLADRTNTLTKEAQDEIQSIATRAHELGARAASVMIGFNKQATSSPEALLSDGATGGDTGPTQIPVGPEGPVSPEGPAGAGEPSPEELAMLVQALQEQGITPEQLEAALAGQGGDPAVAGAPAADPAAAGPDAGGELSPEELQLLVQTLAEQGITPEDLEAELATLQSGAGESTPAAPEGEAKPDGADALVSGAEKTPSEEDAKLASLREGCVKFAAALKAKAQKRS